MRMARRLALIGTAVLCICSMAFGAPQPESGAIARPAAENSVIQLTYDNMLAFMHRYSEDYSKWCNEPESIDKLERYWASDFVAKAFMHLEGQPYPFVQNLGQFKNFILKGHADIEEKLIPVEILIDERKSKATVLLRIQKTVKKSRVVFNFDAMALYQLTADQDKTIKIKSLEIFTDNPGKLTQWVK